MLLEDRAETEPAHNEGFSEAQKVISRLSAMAMLDEEFKGHLKTHPATVLAENGLELPSDMKIEILESFEEIPTQRAAHTIYLVIPRVSELMQEDLSMTMAAAKSCQSTASTMCGAISCLSTATSASTNSCH